MKYFVVAFTFCLMSFVTLACSSTGDGPDIDNPFVGSGVVIYIDTAG